MRAGYLTGPRHADDLRHAETPGEVQSCPPTLLPELHQAHVRRLANSNLVIVGLHRTSHEPGEEKDEAQAWWSDWSPHRHMHELRNGLVPSGILFHPTGPPRAHYSLPFVNERQITDEPRIVEIGEAPTESGPVLRCAR